jgi:hypothetical protein
MVVIIDDSIPIPSCEALKRCSLYSFYGIGIPLKRVTEGASKGHYKGHVKKGIP